MKIRAKCPGGCQLSIPSKYLGKGIVCPKCNTSFTVEMPQGESVIVDTDRPAPVEHLLELDVRDQPLVSSRQIDEGIRIDTRRSAKAELPEVGQLRSQVTRFRNDRILVARFVAILFLIVGLANLVPGIYHWYLWSTNPIQTVLPRWIFLVIFVAALHVLYSVFVFQICDWSALSAIAVVTLVFAGVFGFVFAELVLAKEQSNLVNYLELPVNMVKTAVIWSAAMLLLELVTCYLTAKESFHWQRIDRLSNRLAAES